MKHLWEIKPRTIVYLFSAGKDSCAALFLTRDVVKRYAEETGAKVYIVYILVPGNTHPLNTWCALTVMQWHKEHYGFEPVVLMNTKYTFPELMMRYGLEIGPRRWCYLTFKLKPLQDFEKYLPKPLLEIDGMKRSDSKHRSEIVSEFQHIERSNGTKYWAWHPCCNMSSKQVFDILRRRPEFACVVNLYEAYSDSLNCVICPYKHKEKYLMLPATDRKILSKFMEVALTSKHWRKLVNNLRNTTLTDFF